MREVVFDFETKEIDVLPKYPPKPVGLAIMVDGQPLVPDTFYLAWGHANGGNCNEEPVIEAVRELAEADDTTWVAHNLAFDAAVLQKHWNIRLPWGPRTVCTMLLTFLGNPYGALSLKEICEGPLGMAPVERDAVREYIVGHGIGKTTDWGAHIWKAPWELVAKYATGDIVRCSALHKFWRTVPYLITPYKSSNNGKVDKRPVGQEKWGIPAK